MSCVGVNLGELARPALVPHAARLEALLGQPARANRIWDLHGNLPSLFPELLLEPLLPRFSFFVEHEHFSHVGVVFWQEFLFDLVLSLL